MTDPSDELKKTVGKALGRLPSGAFVLTLADPNAAMLVSWVQQAAFDPPAITLALAKGRPLAELLKQKKTFALSILADDDQPLLKKYARGIPPGEDPFAGVNTTTTPSGTPILADALAYLDCQLLTVCAFSADHELIVARITSGKLLKEGTPFLHFRGNGFHY